MQPHIANDLRMFGASVIIQLGKSPKDLAASIALVASYRAHL